MARTGRSAEAEAYRRWYKTSAWKRLRLTRLEADNWICRMCGAALVRGRTSPRAATVDHVKPHKGNQDKFFDYNNTQSLCKDCHDRHKQGQEARGYSNEIGPDGLPVDPMHPFNQ